MQDPGAKLPPPPGDGLALPRAPARRRIGYSRLDRHRVRGDRPMNTHALPKQRMKVPEFLAWAGKQPETARYELVDGEIIAMTRDTVGHNRAKFAAAIALRAAIRAAGVPCEVFIDGVGVKIKDGTLRIPDVV